MRLWQGQEVLRSEEMEALGALHNMVWAQVGAAVASIASRAVGVPLLEAERQVPQVHRRAASVLRVAMIET